MAHNLFDERMAFVGQTAWHGLGKKVPRRCGAEEMIRAAGLNWPVWVKPAPGAEVDHATGVYDRNLVMRGPLGDESEEVALGWVGPRYRPLQNATAFGFFEPFVDRGWAQFETAGALRRGEVIWVLARLKGDIKVSDSDILKRYLLLCNSHDGSSAVSVRFTAVRVVCENTLNLAKTGSQSGAAHRIRHTRSVVANLRAAQASKLKEIADDIFRDAERSFGEMAKLPMTKESTRRYLDRLHPRTDTQKGKGEFPLRWQRVWSVLDDKKVTPPETKETLWGLYNAVVHEEDFRSTREIRPDARLRRIWLGSGSELKLAALAEARRLVDRQASRTSQ